MSYEENLRQKLNQHVEDSGESLWQIARNLDMHNPLLYGFARGEKGLNAENGLKLASYLGIKP